MEVIKKLNILVAISFMSVFAKPSESKNCQWYQYYDSTSDSCGHCNEICLGVLSQGRVTIGTEAQCRDQCSDYLKSENCTYLQYYDPNVHDCAPCQELCQHMKILETEDQCNSECKKYLVAKQCKADEYLDEKAVVCSSCSELCTFNASREPPKECSEKCPEYVEKNQPGNIIVAPSRSDKGSADASIPDNGSTFHPGFLIVLFVGGAALFVGVAALLWKVVYKRNHQYEPAPRAVDDDAAGTPVQQTPSSQHANVVAPSSLNTNTVEPRTNSRETDIHIPMTSTVPVQDGASAFDSLNGSYGIAEMDPSAPSSAAFEPVQRLSVV